jgi:hypothetical protein
LKNGKLTYMLIAACAALVLLMLLWPMDTKNTENEAPEAVELTAGDYTRALSAQIRADGLGYHGGKRAAGDGDAAYNGRNGVCDRR